MLQKTIALGKQLSKKEMRNVKGGACYAHSADWSYVSNPFDSQAGAQTAADNYASNNGSGNRGFYCCNCSAPTNV